MADELNKDVVAARLNLDTSKMIQSFKIVDEGARGNAESFKKLNAELAAAEKSYKSLSGAADKASLTSEERRKKILAESEALVKQRTAQAELLTAKKQQLDQTNNLVDAKLQAQLAIVKKREASIEQQEREHQQRLLNLQKKNESQAQVIEARLAKEQQTLKAGQSKIEQQEQQHQQKMALLQQKTLGAGAQENLIQSRIDREFQLIRNGNRRIEMEEERHAARMNKMLNSDSVLDRSSQYMLSGTMYYAVMRGATEAISVLKDFEYELVNVKRIMGDTADVEFVKESMIGNAKEYGYALTEVAEVYTLIAQQGFNERQTEFLAKTALMAANVEQSFQSAAQAQELMTGAILNYGMAAEDSERLLDKLNEVSNNYPTTSKKLLEGINRVGAAAKNAGVDINELIGYLTVLNQSGFTGSVAGNAIKSFISFSSRDIAIDKLEKYVGVMRQANGEMMPFNELLSRIAEQWHSLADAERHEITQAVARGDQASRFIALMNNYSKVIDVATTAENSFGSAQRENALAMTTLEKQSMQLKAAWDQLIVTMGDSGLLTILKELTHTATLMVDGFNSLPTPIRNTMTSVLLLGGAITVLNTGTKLFTGQTLISLVTGLANGARAMMGMKTATDAANASQKAFVATPIGAALTAISLAIGVATTAWSYYKGAQNEATDSTKQNERDAYALSEKYQELKAVIDDNTKSDREIKQAKEELTLVIEKLSKIMPEMISQWDENGKAVDLNADKILSFSGKYKESLRIIEEANLQRLANEREKLQKDLDYYNEKMEGTTRSLLDLEGVWRSIKGIATNTPVVDFDPQNNTEEFARKLVDVSEEIANLDQKIKNSQDSLDILNGKTTGLTDFNDKLAASANAASDGIDDLGDSISDAADEEGILSNRAKELIKSHEQLTTRINENGSAVKELNGLSRELSEGQSLNAQNAADLIQKYPQLADAIYKTADGWAFEKDAVEVLRKAKIQKAIDELEAEKNSALNVKLATDERLQAYGIEAEAIKSLADLKAKLNGTQSDVLSSGDDLKYFKSQFREQGKTVMAGREAVESEINAIYSEYEAEMKGYDEKIKALSGLYNDPNFGASDSSKKKGSSSKSKKDNPLQKEFEASQKYIEHQKAIGRMSLQDELSAWERVQARFKEGTEQRLKSDEKVYALRKQIAEETVKKEKEAYDASTKWISHQKGIREVSAQEELEMLLRVQTRYNEGTEIRMQLDEKVYAAKKAVDQEYFSNFQKGLNHRKALEQISVVDEIKEWTKIQSMYREGTDQRMQAEEQIYALKKKLLQDGQKLIIDSSKTIKASLDKAKDEAIKRIEEERDAFLSAQDEKIRAIDDQIKAMDRFNEGDDFERALAEKQAREELLQSAVGPDGIKERKQVQKDIEDMLRDRERKLARQSLEDQKQQLQDEKTQKEKDYNEQISAARSHYESLSSTFDNFSVEMEFKAENLKQVQILKESEKNAEILRQLDQFITDYEAKMSKINTLSGTVSTSTQSSSSGKIQEVVRKLFDVNTYKSKLQIFHEGGVVQGLRGTEVPVLAKAGEMYINEQQQSNLFKLLNFKIPTLNFSMPSFSMAGASGGSNQQVINNSYVVKTGDTYIEDESTARVYWSEKDNFIRRMQSRGGKG